MLCTSQCLQTLQGIRNNNKMSYQLQATVDLCFNISSFRNLTSLYLRSIYFQISCSCGQQTLAPYLIISDNENPSSITLFEYVSPLYSMGPQAKVHLDELAVFRINVPVSKINKNNLKYTFTFYQSLHDKSLIRLDQITVEHTSLLWINSLCPIFSTKCGSAVDVSVQSQLLKVRLRNIKQSPKWMMIQSVQNLLLSYNKLKNRLASKTQNNSIINNIQNQLDFDDICEKLTVELEEVTKISSKRIFQEEGDKIKNKEMVVEFAEKYLPLIGDLVQKNWQVFLKQLKGQGIAQQKQVYLTSLSLLIKNNLIDSPSNKNVIKDNSQHLLIDTMKIPPFTVSIKELTKMEKEEEQQYEQEEQVENSPHHFVILVHGYGATSMTMLQLQLSLRYLYPRLIILNSKFNEDKTQDNFHNMGKRLATEVQLFISNYKCGQNYCISFIAHSMGGLIVRAALTQMEAQKYHMKCFVTLATPHLGHLFHNSSINKFGMWAFSKLKGSQVMTTLLLQQNNKPYRQSYLYQLSSMSGMNWFKRVLFYGCPTDKFVSLQSALCTNTPEIISQSLDSNQKATIWLQMQKNITHQLSQTTFSQSQADFSQELPPQEPNFADEWLGRRDHMNFCLSKSFIQILSSNRTLFA